MNNLKAKVMQDINQQLIRRDALAIDLKSLHKCTCCGTRVRSGYYCAYCTELDGRHDTLLKLAKGILYEVHTK